MDVRGDVTGRDATPWTKKTLGSGLQTLDTGSIPVAASNKSLETAGQGASAPRHVALLDRDDHEMITNAARFLQFRPGGGLREMHQLERVRPSGRGGRTGVPVRLCPRREGRDDEPGQRGEAQPAAIACFVASGVGTPRRWPWA